MKQLPEFATLGAASGGSALSRFRPMRAFLPFLLVAALSLRASDPDLIEARIRALVDINSKTKGICEVHDVQMERRQVPVTFGLPPPPSAEYVEAMQRDFPHSLAHIEGGCVIDEKFLHVRFPWYVCPECKRAEHKWAERHDDTPEGKNILWGKNPIHPDLSG